MTPRRRLPSALSYDKAGRGARVVFASKTVLPFFPPQDARMGASRLVTPRMQVPPSIAARWPMYRLTTKESLAASPLTN